MDTGTVDLFVGCAANHEDAESQAVLEYTARKNCSAPLSITWMQLRRDPASPFSGWNTSTWATPFTAFRWAVPHLAVQKGARRAIYTDSDFIIQGDLAKLAALPLHPNKAVMAKSQNRTCCMLIDAEKLAPLMPPLEKLKAMDNAHTHMLRLLARHDLVEFFPPNQKWNCLDGENLRLDHPSIMAIHYTAMRHQPQLEFALPRLQAQGLAHWFDGQPEPHWRPDMRDLFRRLLYEAEAAGYTVDRYCNTPLFGPYKKKSVAHVKRVAP